MTTEPISTSTLGEVRQLAQVLKQRIQAAVQGRDEVIDLLLYALLGDGHVLLEDYPGSGKTTLAKALGESIDNDKESDLPHFRRVQFTPDLLPSDVTGVMIFDSQKSDFYFRRGPLFSYVVLADEINRTSPKVQAALLEAMAEKQVTIENQTHALDPLFFVIATQNPLDLMGTYPLPFAQLDRFLFKIKMKHLTREDELKVLSLWKTNRLAPALAKVSRAEILRARNTLREHVKIDPLVFETLVDIFRSMRNDNRVIQGGSTRAMVLALPALQARATLENRDYVAASDIDAVLVPLLQHRLEFRGGVENPEEVIREIAKPWMERLAQTLTKTEGY